MNNNTLFLAAKIKTRLLSFSLLLCFLLFSMPNIYAHPEDNWQDSLVYLPNTPSHKVVNKHFRNSTEAVDACNAYALSLGYSGCGGGGDNEGYRFVEGGWFKLDPSGANWELLHFYYDQYFLEIPEPKSCPEGNPCSLASGVKTQIETDFISSGINELIFTRTYSSASKNNHDLGNNWQHNYSMSLSQTHSYVEKHPDRNITTGIYPTEERACTWGWAEKYSTVYNGALIDAVAVYENGQCKILLDGKVAAYLKIHSNNPFFNTASETNAVILSRSNDDRYIFEQTGGIWQSQFNPRLELTKEIDHWIFTDTNGKQEIYNLSGQLIEIISRGGVSQVLSYNLSVAEGGDDNPLSLDKVLNEFGSQLLFSYDSNQKLNQIQTPKGNIVYQYDATQNLIQVTFEDGESKQYVYEDVSYPNHLTGIIDQKNIRFATWNYDEEGRSILSEHAGGAESVTFEFLSSQTKTTDSLGASRTYGFDFLEGSQKIKTVTGERCQNCNHSGYQSQTFNTDGQLVTRTDWNGIVTSYEYTNQFLTTKKIAFGTPDEKTITTTWDEVLQLPLVVIDGNKKITFTYDSKGNLLTNTTTDIALGENRTISYSYDGNGLVIGINGAREDVNDITSFEYDAQGRLKKVINALAQTTEITSYDSTGLPLTIVHPNNLVELRTYHSRGWLLSQSIDGANTQYGYDEIGLLIQIIDPRGVVQQLEYDDARRLTATVDGEGNRTEYTVDLAGNVLQTKIIKFGGIETYSQTNEYNQLSQLVKTISGQSVENTFEYDTRGSLTKATDGLLNSKTSTVDALARLQELLDPDGGLTQFSYDALDQLTSVTDAENQSTLYEYNAFGDLTKLTSPNTGIATFSYDSAGNVLTKIDARGITVTFTYDALNRLLTQTYADTGENITYNYDETTGANKGLGRLTSVTDQTGSTSYFYNAFGLVTQETRVVEGESYLTQYHYDVNAQLTGITYPSGRILDYSFDALGRVNGLTTTYQGETKTLASNINYLPFGPMTGFTYGNGKVLNQSFDLDYRLTDKSTSGLNQLSYGYDLTNNITSITDALNSNNDRNYSYDSLSRLLTASGSIGDFGFTYDKVGNRLTKTENGLFDDYNYESNSHRLEDVTGSNPLSLTYDAIGNTLTKGNETFSYNQQGRLQTANNVSMAVDYRYNYKGERSSKSLNGTTTHYVYDLQGQLIAEADGQGVIVREYVYLNGQRLAFITETNSTPLPPPVDFNVTPIESYGGSQDAGGTATIENDGNTVRIVGNAWKKITLPYTVTSNTVIEFDFSSSAQGEIHGIGFDADNGISFNQTFKLFGTQSWGNLTYNNYDGSGNTIHYKIPVGQFYTGSMNYLFFANDHDVSNANGESVYSNIRIYEEAPSSNAADVNFNATPIQSYGGSQDAGGTATIEDGGSTIRIVGNAWKKITLPYTVTTDTVIEFDFSSSAQGEIHGIGFDTDNGISSNRTFRLYGTQGWGNSTFSNYDGSGNVTHYTIPVGQFYTGSMNYLFFANDHDVSNATGESVYSNIRVYEANAVPVSTQGIFYLHTDHLNTPTAVSDETGDIQWKASYSPFGKAIVEINNLENNLRFPGQYFDSETGLHYNYFRDYDPEIGRYIQSDPIGLAGGVNTYGYVGGNPVSRTDPMGLCFGFCTIPVAVGLGRAAYQGYRAYRAAQVIAPVAGSALVLTGDTPNSRAMTQYDVEQMFRPWQTSEVCEDDEDNVVPLFPPVVSDHTDDGDPCDEWLSALQTERAGIIAVILTPSPLNEVLLQGAVNAFNQSVAKFRQHCPRLSTQINTL